MVEPASRRNSPIQKSESSVKLSAREKSLGFVMISALISGLVTGLGLHFGVPHMSLDKVVVTSLGAGGMGAAASAVTGFTAGLFDHFAHQEYKNRKSK
jgi:hypothetical protein